MYLHKIANTYYNEEGFDSPREFMAFWNIIHPKKKYQPNLVIYVHEFELLPEEGN